MTRPALLPAALRLALRGVVLLGGLFALGFLLGGQAQAADGTTTTAATATATTATPVTATPVTATATTATVTTPTATRLTATRLTATRLTATTVTAVTSTTKAVVPSPALSGASTNAGSPVLERVVKPVGEVLAGVSEKLAEAEAAPVVSLPSVPQPPILPSLGTLPELPGSPTLPGLPPLPSLPSLPSPPSLPTLPVSQPGPALTAPVASGPGQDSGTVEAAAPQSPYGLRGVVREAPVGPVAHGGGWHRAGHTAIGGHRPVQGTPAGVPDGALGSTSLLDGGGSRHADAYAVTPYHRVPLLLVPGSAVPADAAGIRDRYRDIPVFPG
ncbi:hypothetical protein [Streptomyces phaeoluteigriseus]